MVGGNSEIEQEKKEASSRFGVPLDLVEEAEGFKTEFNGIYPDNMAPVAIFVDLTTQWRVGMNGITGLDYGALPAVLSIRQIKRDDRAEIFECLQVMERATLKKVRER